MKAGPTEPSATSDDLKQLALALLLFELVIAALTIATRAFFGVRTAVWVGVGIGILVFLTFALIVLFGIFTHTLAAFLARRVGPPSTWRSRSRAVACSASDIPTPPTETPRSDTSER